MSSTSKPLYEVGESQAGQGEEEALLKNETVILFAAVAVVAAAAESAAASAASRLGTAAELDVAAARAGGRRWIEGGEEKNIFS